MDDEFAEAVAGALAAQGFVLENLYALLLASDADPVRACQATAHRMREDFSSLQATGVQVMTDDEVNRIKRHALDRLERFWNGVERRLASLPQT